MHRKGIILAGGFGSRLRPITQSISKQLLPVYNKPMIYYSLTTLMLSGIRKILLISTRQQIKIYQDLLSDGSRWGITLKYKVQDNPNGIAEALILGEDFIKKSKIALILGDNLFYSNDLSNILKKMSSSNKNSIICNEVSNPSNYGIISIDKNNNIVSIDEKPIKPKSNYAITGLYFLNNDTIEIAKNVKPSKRGELEITSINEMYLNEESLYVEIMGRGFTWLDTGTFDSLVEASNFISIMQRQQGFNIACLEEIAYNNNWITKDKLLELVRHKNSPYHNYIKDLISQ